MAQHCSFWCKKLHRAKQGTGKKPSKKWKNVAAVFGSFCASVMPSVVLTGSHCFLDATRAEASGFEDQPGHSLAVLNDFSSQRSLLLPRHSRVNPSNARCHSAAEFISIAAANNFPNQFANLPNALLGPRLVEQSLEIPGVKPGTDEHLSLPPPPPAVAPRPPQMPPEPTPPPPPPQPLPAPPVLREDPLAALRNRRENNLIEAAVEAAVNAAVPSSNGTRPQKPIPSRPLFHPVVSAPPSSAAPTPYFSPMVYNTSPDVSCLPYILLASCTAAAVIIGGGITVVALRRKRRQNSHTCLSQPLTQPPAQQTVSYVYCPKHAPVYTPQPASRLCLPEPPIRYTANLPSVPPPSQFDIVGFVPLHN